jgi:hypothetical protein
MLLPSVKWPVTGGLFHKPLHPSFFAKLISLKTKEKDLVKFNHSSQHPAGMGGKSYRTNN